jgi:hypothetical protein
MRNVAKAGSKRDFRDPPVSRIVEQITRAGRNPFVVDVLSNRASRPSKQLVYVALRAMKLSRSREDFTYDHTGDVYRCPGGKVLTTTGALVNDGVTMLYVASKRRLRSMPTEVPVLPEAGITEGAALDLRRRSRHGAPNRKVVGGPQFASAPQKDRDAVRAPQAHSQA